MIQGIYQQGLGRQIAVCSIIYLVDDGIHKHSLCVTIYLAYIAVDELAGRNVLSTLSISSENFAVFDGSILDVTICGNII